MSPITNVRGNAIDAVRWIQRLRANTAHIGLSFPCATCARVYAAGVQIPNKLLYLSSATYNVKYVFVMGI